MVKGRFVATCILLLSLLLLSTAGPLLAKSNDSWPEAQHDYSSGPLGFIKRVVVSLIRSE